ncbi:MAG: tRNA glutamyl-Q(34) synthetase GluQRS [Spongiibacteraceae bacterium]
MHNTRQQYIGRFAPSPTGPLHFGSLLTALASFLDARANNGRWLLRIEDIDPPRAIEGAANAIIQSLQCHKLLWDGDIIWQSQRSVRYEHYLQKLLDQQRAFYCSCSRTQLAAHNGGPHSGACVTPAIAGNSAIRLRATGKGICFDDRLQGPQQFTPHDTSDDFILKRRDHLYAYQLAVVVDDHEDNISDIVRGSDLLDSTPRQICLQQQLELPTPRYLHLPLILGTDGNKLSKQNHAPAIDDSQPIKNIRQALHYLQQPPPPSELKLDTLLRWATTHWQASSIPAHANIPG